MNNNYLIHIGNKNSGRYPRGSGERPNQHEGVFRKKINRQKNRMERREIARDSYKLSDEELDTQIKRLNKESQLKDLTKRVNSGRGETNKNIKKVAGIAVTTIATAGAAAAGKYLVDKYIEGNKYKQMTFFK